MTMKETAWQWGWDPAGVLDSLIKRSREIKRVLEDPVRRPGDPAAWGEIIRHLQAAKAAASPLYEGSIPKTSRESRDR